MEYLLLGARLLLAAVFLVSSIGKLLDLGGAKSAMEGFGVPASISRPASWLLIAAELIVAVLLIPASTAWWGALGALLLLGAFIVGISYNMTKGNHPDCHCFGQFHSEPAGWPTLIRNGVLGAVALFVVLYGTDRWSFSHGNAGVSAVDWIRDLTTWETIVTILGIVALLALAGLAWLVVHLLGQNGRVLLRLDALEAQMEKVGQGVPAAAAGIAAPATQPAAAPTPAPAGLPVGSQAPAFKLEGIYGETMTLDALKAQGKPIMLLFTDPGCGPCNALLPDIAKWQKQHAGVLTVSLISSGTAEANRNKAAEHGITQVLLQPNRDVSTQYKAHGTPSAVIVTANGVIDSPIAAGSAAIRQLVATRTGAPAPAPAAARPAAAAPAQPAPAQPAPAQPVRNNGAAAPAAAAPAPAPAQPAAAPLKPGSGAPAPDVSLPDLAGNTVNLKDFRGQNTMLLFWNPGCGFCRKMADELKEWEANPQANAPKLLVVSTGTVEANEALGLRSTTLLDQGFTTGRAFGASGTPSAVLVDAGGRVASGVAVGGPNVMAMARGQEAPPPAPAQAPAADTAPKAGSGEPAPEVVLPDLTGKTVSLKDFRGTNTMLLFWNPGCGFCRKMADELKEWEANPPKGSPRLLVVSTGTVEANQAMGIQSTTVLDEGFKTGRAFGASGTPSSVLVDAKGRIASAVSVGGPAVMAMARGEKAPAPAAGAPAPPPAPAAKKGESAPAVELKDIDGRDFKLSNQRGRDTVLLFWNPGCGFCKRMTDDLNTWLGSRPAASPEIVLVSTGGPDANRAMGINATILLDEAFSTGRKFGAGGTPSGVLIDANGNVASDVAVGAQAVLSLAGAPQGAPS